MILVKAQAQAAYLKDLVHGFPCLVNHFARLYNARLNCIALLKLRDAFVDNSLVLRLWFHNIPDLLLNRQWKLVRIAAKWHTIRCLLDGHI
jgi:hypothetical protein